MLIVKYYILIAYEMKNQKITVNIQGLFGHIYLNLFLKIIFKLKNKKQFLKTSFKKNDQTDPYFSFIYKNQ